MPTLKQDQIIGADTDLAADLELGAINDEPTYRQGRAIVTNLARKVKRGVYDPVLAGRLWRYAVEAYLPTYKRDAGEPRMKVNAATKNLAGRLLEKYYRDEVYQAAGVAEPTFPGPDAELHEAEHGTPPATSSPAPDSLAPTLADVGPGFAPSLGGR